jgi:PEP-CTERM motif
MVQKQLNRSFVLVLSLLTAAGAGSAATILGGLEDWAGSSGYERNGDFNDLVFQISGDISFNAPGGVFNNLTSSAVNETGTAFWDNPSGDGSDLNIGYRMLGQGGNLQYLSTAPGGSVNYVTFSAEGPLTITLLGGITADTAGDTLGWYDPSNPSVSHLLFSGIVPGATMTFTPGSSFALYSDNGWGPGYSSIAADNEDESSTQQHFAFFTAQGSTVPEPSTALLAGLGLALLAIGSVRLRKRARRA